MCLMLPICMVFLFRGLLRFRGREVRGLRTAARVIYLVHPMVIVTVRAAAKITHLEALLVKSNLVYFVAVCVISFLFGFAVAALWWRFAVKQKHITVKECAYIELDLASLAYNAAILQAAGGCALRTADSAPPEPEEPAETMQETAEPEIPLETADPAPGTLPQPEPDDFVPVAEYLPQVWVDLRYATENNFTGQIIYDFTDVYLRYGTVEKLAQVQAVLEKAGYSLLIWDAFRPAEAQFRLWEVCPDPVYVANPENGFSSHSRGNSDRATLYRHVLRNAMGPVVSFLAMTVADIVAGSVVIEQVFSLPGLGRMLLTSIANRDYPVVQAVVVIVAFWVVLVNLLADLINQRLDPRLRLT